MRADEAVDEVHAVEFQFKSISPVHSNDMKWVRWMLEGLGGETVKVDMPIGDFVGVMCSLTEFAIQMKTQGALYAPGSSSEGDNPQRAPALLQAKELGVVVFESGGCSLRLQTSHGADLEILLDQSMTEFLVQSLLHKKTGEAETWADP